MKNAKCKMQNGQAVIGCGFQSAIPNPQSEIDESKIQNPKSKIAGPRPLAPGPIELLVQRLPNAKDLPMPGYATGGSAGIDLLAAVERDKTLFPGERALIPTGIRIAVPEGYEAQVRPRSGLALKYGFALVNSPGTIDSDYRGEVQVIIINLGSEPVAIQRGDRIAQMVIAPVIRATLVESEELPETKRGHGGFGHTGV